MNIPQIRGPLIRESVDATLSTGRRKVVQLGAGLLVDAIARTPRPNARRLAADHFQDALEFKRAGRHVFAEIQQQAAVRQTRRIIDQQHLARRRRRRASRADAKASTPIPPAAMLCTRASSAAKALVSFVKTSR